MDQEPSLCAIIQIPSVSCRLPIRFEECSPEVQKMIRQRRMPKGTLKKEKDIDFAFDPMKYAK